MRFSTIFSVFACGTMALATAVPSKTLVSQDLVGEVSTILNELSAAVDGIVFDGCTSGDCTAELVGQITGLIDGSTALVAGIIGTVTVDDSLAEDVAAVVKKCANKLGDHKKSCHGKCGSLAVYDEVDVSLTACLNGLETVVPGILELVSELLSPVTDLLNDLGLTSVTSLLGSVLDLVGGLLGGLLG